MCRVIVVPAIGCTSVEHSSNHCDACMLTGMPFALSIHVQINIYMYIYPVGCAQTPPPRFH